MLMDLLVLLAENAGQMVSKEEILDRLWQSRFVSESALTNLVAELRGLLGDSSRQPYYVETIPKRGYRWIAPVEAGQPALPRLAVLPFVNLNRDPEQDYFADGLADALTTELGSIGSLRVISRQSVLRFRGTGKSVAEIASELKVDTVVEGSALLAGTRVRITAQLIAVEPERHLWARSYECDLGDVVTLQGQVARAVAESVRAVLEPKELARLLRVAPANPEAQLAYLKARHHGSRWTQEGVQKGLQYLGEAIEKDPNYAPAHALLAVSLAVLGYWGHLPIREAYPRAKEAALKAVELEDSLAEGHVALGLTHWLLDWNLPACERETRRGLELNPSSEQAHFWLAMFLLIIRRDGRSALEEARLALELDPLSLITGFAMAYLLMFAGEYEQAVDQARKTLELYPDALHPYYVLGWAWVAESKYAEAVAAFEKAATISRDVISLAYLAHAYGRAGQRNAAQALLAELLDKRAREHVPEFALALVHTGLGDLDRAFESFERCYEQRDSRLFWLPFVPCFDPLRADPRYHELLRRMGLAAQTAPAAETRRRAGM